LRLLTKESSKIQADDIRMVTQRVEPSPASKLHPERRWIVGFSEANTASNFAEKVRPWCFLVDSFQLNNQSAGLSQVKCRLLGEVKFTDNYMVNPMIKAKYVPRGINSHSLREWVSPVVNLAFTTSTLYGKFVSFSDVFRQRSPGCYF
jgi:hypothetical protein